MKSIILLMLLLLTSGCTMITVEKGGIVNTAEAPAQQRGTIAHEYRLRYNQMYPYVGPNQGWAGYYYTGYTGPQFYAGTWHAGGMHHHGHDHHSAPCD